MKQFNITYTNADETADLYHSIRVEAETTEQATAYFIAHRAEQGYNSKVVGCSETTAPLKPSEPFIPVPEGWEPQRTTEEITTDIIGYFNDNEDVFNDLIEELDGYNGYLGDDRYYDMEALDEFYSGIDPLELLQRVYFGYAEGEYIVDKWGEEHRREFNPNADYFRYNGYGNLVSTDYKDYSDHIDEYTVKNMIENRDELDRLDNEPDLIALFDEYEEVQDNE